MSQPRTPDYVPSLAEGLIWQILAILQRDLVANLQLVNPEGGYAGIVIERFNSAAQDIYENAPAIIVEPISSEILQDEQIALTVRHQFAVSAIVAGDGDTERLARQARDFARAMVASLGRKQDLTDYWTPLPFTGADGVTSDTAGMTPGSIGEVSLLSVNWALKAPQGDGFARQPIVTLAITAVEL